MNADFACPRIPPAGLLLPRPKSNQKAAGNQVSRSLSFIHPGFLNVAAIHGILTDNYMRLPGASAVFHPRKEASLFGVLPQMSELVFRVKSLNMFCD
jgi:hypothetical protein